MRSCIEMFREADFNTLKRHSGIYGEENSGELFVYDVFFYPRKMGLVDKAKQSMRKKCEGLKGGDAHYDCMMEETNILLNT